MIKLEVYELSRNFDPRFDGFDFKGKSLLTKNEWLAYDFEPSSYSSASWKPNRLRKLWKPQKVEGKVRPFNDFPSIGPHVPVFSKRAVESLRDLLEIDGEILELIHDSGEYFAYNVLTKLDALDVDKTKGELFVDESVGECFVEIFEFVIKPKVLTGHSIFRLSHFPKCIFVTSAFKSRVEQAGLNGMDFIKVWPFPKGVNWEKEDIKRKRKLNKETAKLSGQGLILKLKSDQAKPSSKELRIAEKLGYSLQTVIAGEKTLESIYLGRLEIVEPSRGAIEIGFSCPDSNKLLQKLVASGLIEWPNAVTAVKLFGNLFDRGVESESIVLSDQC